MLPSKKSLLDPFAAICFGYFWPALDNRKDLGTARGMLREQALIGVSYRDILKKLFIVR